MEATLQLRKRGIIVARSTDGGVINVIGKSGLSDKIFLALCPFLRRNICDWPCLGFWYAISRITLAIPNPQPAHEMLLVQNCDISDTFDMKHCLQGLPLLLPGLLRLQFKYQVFPPLTLNWVLSILGRSLHSHLLAQCDLLYTSNADGQAKPRQVGSC